MRAWGFALAFLALDSALLGWWWRSRPAVPPTVAGVVVDPEGRPVEGVVSWPLSLGHRDEGGFRTDEQGRFEVLLPDREDVLVAYGSGHSESAPLALDGTSGRSVEGVVLRLRRPARVVGRLVDEAGLPMAGVIVSCRSGTTANVCLMNESTTTDDDGRFEFEERAPGQASLLTCRASRAIELTEGARTEALVTLSANEAREHRRIKTIQDGLERRARERLR